MKKVIITIGDPAGCGPFITLKAIDTLKKNKIEFLVVGDREILRRVEGYSKLEKRINIIDINTPGIGKIDKPKASSLGGRASLAYLNKALAVAINKKIKSLVTAPLSKEAVKLIHPSFSGHTEYLASYFGVKNFAMMMVSPLLRVVLLTRHIPLREVPSQLRMDSIISTIKLVKFALQNQFRIKNPRIAISSLNPHAGITTFMDKEEKVLFEAIKKVNLPIYGPFPSDTIFLKDNLKKFHCIICPYHDQAMIPFKIFSFYKGVNLTLGLPIIRTSPAHGVAYDLIEQKKKISWSSMVEAIKLSLKL